MDRMQQQLNELAPLLEEKKAAAQKLLAQVGGSLRPHMHAHATVSQFVRLCTTRHMHMAYQPIARTLTTQVSQEQADASAIAAVVASEEAEVAARAAQTAKLKDEAQADLAAALPALEAATQVCRVASSCCIYLV